MKHALSIPNMGDPAALVEIAVAADAHGWDGAFFWDHVVGTRDFAVPMADLWVMLGAVAVQTERIRLGTGIAALPRRAVQEVARQVVTVDHLSGGRMVLGVGLGEPPSEYTALGRSPDRRELAARLDESLVVLEKLWSGEPVDHEGRFVTLRDAQFLPVPQQQPRPPVWCSAMTVNERTLGRASRWDGAIVGAMGEDGSMLAMEPQEVRAAAAALHANRPDGPPPDLVVGAPLDLTPGLAGEYEAAGATWLLTSGMVDDLASVAAAPPLSR